MNNKFLELASSPLMNLDHTKRYSGTKLVEEETLSQHIVDTIMMGIKIIDQINGVAGNKVLDSKVYVMKAVYHDLEEVITGDIPRPLKYYNDQTRDSLKSVADSIAHGMFQSQFIDWKESYDYWESAKSGDEGFILKLVDVLVVANKVVKEVLLLNNFYMLRVAHEVAQYLTELYDRVEDLTYTFSFDDMRVTSYILDILDGAISTMNKLIEENSDCMNSLNIAGQSMI